MRLITTEVAWRLRSERGLLLPIDNDAHYVDPAVAKIAKRQSELMAEMDQLDNELRRLAEGAAAEANNDALRALDIKHQQLHAIARRMKDEGMQCNCDLDNWEPEVDTGHSHVCRIHAASMPHPCCGLGSLQKRGS